MSEVRDDRGSLLWDMPDELEFTIAHESDWAEIWPIFREVVCGGDTYMFSPDMGEDAARSAWMFDGTGRHVTFVARLNGTAVGTAFIKPNAPGLGDHIANGGWMVSPVTQGLGVGRGLAEFAIEHARSLGFHGMQFNAVVSTNAPAIKLWKSLGFEIVGTVPDAFRHSKLGLTPIHIMFKTL